MTERLRIIIFRFFLIFILFIIGNVEVQKNNKTFFHSLPAGEFQLILKRKLMCNSTNHKIQFNWYLKRISLTKIVVDGNLTFKVPFDDTISVIISLDQRKINGEWTNNLMVLKKDKACTSMKLLLKEDYYEVFGWPPNKPCTCPFPVDTYISKGIPAVHLEEVMRNIPNILIYGTYRLRLKFMDKNNEEISCLSWVVDIKRPWESL